MAGVSVVMQSQYVTKWCSFSTQVCNYPHMLEMKLYFRTQTTRNKLCLDKLKYRTSYFRFDSQQTIYKSNVQMSWTDPTIPLTQLQENVWLDGEV